MNAHVTFDQATNTIRITEDGRTTELQLPDSPGGWMPREFREAYMKLSPDARRQIMAIMQGGR